MAAALDEKKPSGEPWWRHAWDVVIAGAKSFVRGSLRGAGPAGEAAAAAMKGEATNNKHKGAHATQHTRTYVKTKKW